MSLVNASSVLAETEVRDVIDAIVRLEQLLHDVNNHATVVCGYLENDPKLGLHITAICNLLNELSYLFNELKETNVNPFKNGEGAN